MPVRYQTMQYLKTDNEIDIYDLTSTDWTTFTYVRGFTKHIVTASEALRPYMISYNEYGTIAYEDIILLLNNIENPLDLEPGLELIIPRILDIKAFLARNRK